MKLQREKKERMNVIESSMFNVKELIQESKGNHAFLKRLIKEELIARPYPITKLIETTEDELRQLKEERNWLLFWMSITIILTLYLNVMVHHLLSPLVCHIGFLGAILLVGFYFKKQAIMLSYDTVISVLKTFQQEQLKAIRLSSSYLDPHYFFQDLLKKIDLYGADCKCYLYYGMVEGKNRYTGYSLCETEIWDPHLNDQSDTTDKIGVMTTTLQNAYDLFKFQIKKY